MFTAHKIRLYPTNQQASLLAQTTGCNRLTYNWMLNKWNEEYAAGGNPTKYTVKKAFNAIKKEQFPFTGDVNAHAVVNDASERLGLAFKNYFSDLKKPAKARRFRRPKFHKKKNGRGSFSLPGAEIKYTSGASGDPGMPGSPSKVYICRIGWLRLAENIRFQNYEIRHITVSEQAGMWFCSFCLEVPDPVFESQGGGAIGIDLGIRALATLSDGTVYANPQFSNRFSRKLRCLQKRLSRRIKGSRNWWKTVRALQRLYYRISCCRNDYVHKMTTEIARKYDTVCIEDLNVSGMVKNHHLARSLMDVSFGEIRRQLEYKCKDVRVIDRFAPSTKTCSSCGSIQEMPLSDRTYVCPECGLVIDRDLNAAFNIKNFAVSSTGSKKPAVMKALALEALASSTKLSPGQEFNVKSV